MAKEEVKIIKEIKTRERATVEYTGVINGIDIGKAGTEKEVKIIDISVPNGTVVDTIQIITRSSFISNKHLDVNSAYKFTAEVAIENKTFYINRDEEPIDDTSSANYLSGIISANTELVQKQLDKIIDREEKTATDTANAAHMQTLQEKAIKAVQNADSPEEQQALATMFSGLFAN